MFLLLSTRSIAIVIVAILVVIYFCSLSIQVIAIHKDYRFAIASGPLIDAAVPSSRHPRRDALEATAHAAPEWNATKALSPATFKIVKEYTGNLEGGRRTLRPVPLNHRAPHFMIIGAQKAGTQALRTYLSDHPNVVMPTKTPETHFFDKHYSDRRGPRWNLETYLARSFEKDCRQRNRTNCVSGESTPFYLYDTQHVPARIKKTCPWTKFIVMLRDPVKRAYSQCSMLIDKNEVNGSTFEQHLEGDLNRLMDVGLITNRTLTVEEEDEAWIKYQDHAKWRKAMIGRGLYEVQLRRWFRFFPREQFLILDSQELELNRTTTMKRVYDFLGLPYHQGRRGGKKIHRRKYKTTMPADVRDFLYDFYHPYNQRLVELLGQEWRGKWGKPTTGTDR